MMITQELAGLHVTCRYQSIDCGVDYGVNAQCGYRRWHVCIVHRGSMYRERNLWLRYAAWYEAYNNIIPLSCQKSQLWFM